MRAILLALLLAGAAAACGGIHPTRGRSDLDPRCPSAVPPAGAACDLSSGPLSCEYGGDALSRGTTLAECSAGAWSLSTPEPTPADNGASCPPTYGAALADGCPACTSACEYDEGRCANVCLGGSPVWSCRARSEVPAALTSSAAAPTDLALSCPAARPLAGTVCPLEGQSCRYAEACGSGPLSFGPSLSCEGGHWRPDAFAPSCLVRAACSGS
jgi:hypothetical protein